MVNPNVITSIQHTHTHLLLSENRKDAGGGMRAPWSCSVSENDGLKAKQRKI